MTEPTEFKDPNITITTPKDDPELYEILKESCLSSWEFINTTLKESHGFNQAQVLTGIISMYVGFLSTAFGPEHTLSLLNEIQRRNRLNNKKN